MFRFVYAIIQAWRYRKQLKRYIVDSSLQLANIREITPEYLRKRNINALVLDYDGVLAAHGEPNPRPEVVEWMRNFYVGYAPHRIFILSNKPNPERIEYFRQNFPAVDFLKAKRKKPYPDGLQEIISLCGLPGSQIMLIDDRLCTGILATMIAGTQGCWITKPYINFKWRPFAELGFIILRWSEKIAIKYLVF